jgi:hypothetical protein
MKFDINTFRTDDDLSKTGVWVDFGGGARMKIASFSNEDFATDFTKRTSPWTKMGVDVPSAEQESIMIDLLAKHILLGWEGVFDGDDVLEFNLENASKLLKEIPFIRSRVIEEARLVSNFRAEEKKAIEKNSVSASDGSQTGAKK